MPVEAWRYKPGLGLNDKPHIGTYAEDFRETFGLGDGKTLDLVDTTGVLMASVKSLSKKVKKLEGLGLTVEKNGLGLIANDGGGVRLDLVASPRPSHGLGLAEAA